MSVLFDTDVVLDALLDRELWAESAVTLFDGMESGGLTGHLGAPRSPPFTTTPRAVTSAPARRLR